MTANEAKDRCNLKADGAVFKERTFNDREWSTFLSEAQLQFLKKRFDALKNRTGRGFRDSLRQDELAGNLSATATFKRSLHHFMQGNANNGAYRTPDLDEQSDATNAYGVFVPVPNEALYILNETCTLKKDHHISRNVMIESMDPFLYNDLIYDPYKNPSYDTVWAFNFGAFTTAYNPDPDGNGNIPDPVTVLDYSTKYGDTRVDPTATLTTRTGFKGLSSWSTDTNPVVIQINTDRTRNLVPGSGWDVEEYNMRYIKAPKPIVVNTRNPLLQQNPEVPDVFMDEVIDLAIVLAAASVAPLEAKYQLADKEAKEDE
jgi:hypothetical protein